MGLKDKLEIEPLSETRWARLERNLFDRVAREERTMLAPRAPRESTRWRAGVAFVMAGAAAAAAGGIAWNAFVSPRAASTIAAAPAHIVTEGSGSRVAVGEASVDLGPQSVAWISGDDQRGIEIVLDRGNVECDVPPRRERPAFIVHAGDVTVRVVGTHFTVSRTGTFAGVAVQHGAVEVTWSNGHTVVHEGESWPAAATPADSTSAPPPPTTAALPEPTATTTATTAPVQPPSLKPRPSAAPSAQAAAPSAQAAAPTPREQYESATGLEASRPGEALAIYRKLSAQGGAWGMNALFAQARLELDRGNRGEARRLMTEYLARYPKGPNAPDARRVLER